MAPTAPPHSLACALPARPPACAQGCSYNPDREQHQDAVALAVAAEMQKVYKKVGV